MGKIIDQLVLGQQLHEDCGNIGHREVYVALVEAALLHAAKNLGYRSSTDPLSNFRSARCVVQGQMTPMQYALTLCDKQDDALHKLVWAGASPEFNERGGLAMLRERALDGITYRCLILALYVEAGDGARPR